MSAAVTIVLADHGDIVSTLPFVLPAFLVVGAVLALRYADRRRDTPED